MSKERMDVAGRVEPGLAGVLEDYVADWSCRTGIAVELWALPAKSVPAGMSEAVLQVIAYALDNVERHSGAGQVSIAVTVSRAGLRLTISDDGRGMRPGAGRSGVARMRAGFVALGGTLSVNGVIGGGTTVSGVLPIAQHAIRA
ncbi:hypothetical protein J5X84_41910 [Streptosporangiaceae bacterium NEAU-GS5]|nr:hypothetical protein [Streptosporangiaceae bacterium NEAU-GS5]